ncbi:branched-chain amino acid aminotransferase [Saccharothrix mutabilis subsp. mutabilis]|uniref:Branched-chain-amino-acid aminotransferase n=1 Tax=Saccharothrix mutabilis subsp. mutabilis TaxID=66855 RepID=A0ABN0UE78_9PSEU
MTATTSWAHLPGPDPLPDARVRERSANAPFGTVFTEHAVTLRWTPERGWHDGAVRPHASMTVPAALSGLHYGQVVFEGLKVYRQPDGVPAGFRVADHARRFAASARRLAIPELPAELFESAIRALLAVDGRWVPEGEGRALYLRPTLYGAESTLALRPAREYAFQLLAFPTEAFFGHAVEPIAVWAPTRYSRAAPGGTGEAKCAGNYAAGFAAQREAVEHGCRQVLWLDAAEHRFVEELGGMNVFWVTEDGTLGTPPLSGTLLPGITRDSILTLAARAGLRTEQRAITLDELCSQATTEVFACGTAAVATPVGAVVGAHGRWEVGDGRAGPVTTGLREALTAIHHGRAPDPDNWLLRLA